MSHKTLHHRAARAPAADPFVPGWRERGEVQNHYFTPLLPAAAVNSSSSCGAAGSFLLFASPLVFPATLEPNKGLLPSSVEPTAAALELLPSMKWIGRAVVLKGCWQRAPEPLQLSSAGNTQEDWVEKENPTLLLNLAGTGKSGSGAPTTPLPALDSCNSGSWRGCGAEDWEGQRRCLEQGWWDGRWDS